MVRNCSFSSEGQRPRIGRAMRPRPSHALFFFSTGAIPRRCKWRARPGKGPRLRATTSPIGRRRRRGNGRSRPEEFAINLVAEHTRDKIMSAALPSACRHNRQLISLTRSQFRERHLDYLFYVAPTALMIGCLIHAVIKQRYFPWLFIIMFLPGIG